ncbi:hypothetical protein A2774_03465 [Candidatus Roizmanbacteria bacterium RIFCSPHIGHO2_01_FULL_39_12c]|uniref:Mechanosensitive ion channel protein MscS n=1 Tax=Candidatus Roizmanbacteria bacterium RIFCSPHIGHO2_01_FULL_39_12c TaxID=1802031 RepID=A0A1F7G9Q8_9BACT|nr:MAG: hypothetical protein A2774_03465 [Candidatus Roizmanbacteria bacterium RIFCSPHIGHO2_01_FULL_39_12c]OGK47840.1 MAG: hypothetical protein A2963_03230 [Candidatus Roizmanbacteria bacterium RIFCSPLOWO2_01_FULL_40_13]
MLNVLGVSDSYPNRFLFSVGAFLVVFIASKIAKKSLNLVFTGLKKKVVNANFVAKTKTIRSLLYNIVDTVLLLIAVLIIFSHWGVDIGPILTGAGILGLAFSFGAQTLVKDVISGFFIIVENQFNIGDKIRIGKIEGEVYQMTLRMTVLKDKDGNFVYIPNSQITTVIKLRTN